MFNLPGRGFRQRITLTSSVLMTLNDVIVTASVKLCSNARESTDRAVRRSGRISDMEPTTRTKNKLHADIAGVLKSAKAPKQT